MDKKLEDLAIEISELHDNLEKAKKENNNEQKKYILAKTKAILKKVTAISAIPIMGATITSLAGWNPFRYNNEKQYAHIIKTIDNNGNITEDKTYKGIFEDCDTQSKVNYYTKWNRTDNNNYKRKKYTYNVSENDMKNVLSLIGSKNEILQDRLDGLFLNYKTVNSEYMADLTMEQLKSPSYLEVLFVEQNKDDFIVTKESKSSHSMKLFTLILMELFLMIAEFELLDKYTNFWKNIDEQLEKEKPELTDIDSIEEKIKTKQLMFEKYPKQFNAE